MRKHPHAILPDREQRLLAHDRHELQATDRNMKNGLHLVERPIESPLTLSNLLSLLCFT